MRGAAADAVRTAHGPLSRLRPLPFAMRRLRCGFGLGGLSVLAGTPQPAWQAVPMQRYRERLTAPPSWWALAALFAVAVGWAFYVATPAWVSAVALAVAAAVAFAVVASYGSATIEVSAEGFRAGRARLPWSAVGEVRTLEGEDARRAAGVDADARAYLVLRGYCGGAVRVEVDDPADPTPYWLVSTRRPRSVAAAMRAEGVQD
jgi:hypothetical protein